MREIPDSQLPRDSEYWDDLVGKIHEDAAGPLAAYAAEDAEAARAAAERVADAAIRTPGAVVATDPGSGDLDAWYGELASRAPGIVAASAAAMLFLWLGLPAPVPAAPESSVAFRWMERSLGPDEPAGTLVSGPAPPSVDALMVQFSPASYSPEGGEGKGPDDPDDLDPKAPR